MGLLALKIGQLPLLLLDERVRNDRRKSIQRRTIALELKNLVVGGFLLDPLGFCSRDCGIQVGQLLDDNVLLFLQRNRIGLLAVALHRLLARLDLPALLGQPFPEPVGRFLRRQELELEILVDVRPGKRVGDPRRKRGIGRLEPDVHEPAVADGRHRQIVQETIDCPRLRLCFVRQRRFARVRSGKPPGDQRDRHRSQLVHCERPSGLRVEPRVIPQLQRLNRPTGERAALQNLVLGLVVIVGNLILLERFLEGDDVRVFLLDQDLNARLVNGRRGERIDTDRQNND